MKKLAPALALSIVLAALPARAEVFGDWDTDGNGELSVQEFGEGFTALGWLRRWDSDGDGVLGRSEFAIGLFDLFDRNEDAQLTFAEWRDGLDPWYRRPAVVFAFGESDVDDDSVVGKAEFRARIGRADLFYTIAGKDGAITASELTDALFRWLDDGDGTLGRDEWAPFAALLG